jgi:hypothetical protein
MKFYTGNIIGPIVTRGEYQTRMLDFALRYPGWHSVTKDRRTMRALDSLVKMRVIEHNPVTQQFRYSDTRGQK